jgi:hypothetical protein
MRVKARDWRPERDARYRKRESKSVIPGHLKIRESWRGGKWEGKT